MPTLARHAPAVATAAPALPPYAHREAYADYFDRLARATDAAPSLRRLIGHIDADLDGAERVALWHAMWRCVRRLPAAVCEATARCLDGRHAERIGWLADDWQSPLLIERLAAAAAPAFGQAAFVPALLAHHGIDVIGEPARHSSALVITAARAAIHGATARAGSETIAALQAAVLDACGRDEQRLPEGLALIFELALHGRDEGTATAILAQLLQHGHGSALRAERVRGWLDGTAFDDDGDRHRPLALAPRWQRQWLQPAAWSQPEPLLLLADALQREPLRRRLHALIDAIGRRSESMPAPAKPGEALRLLGALDRAYQLADGGGDPLPLLQPLLGASMLDATAVAALHRSSAAAFAAAGSIEAGAAALARARRAQATPGVRSALAALLPGAPALDGDWRSEEPLWKALLRDGAPPLQRAAAFQLASLWTEGSLEPRAPIKRQRLDAAHALWQWLAESPPLAKAAQAALRSPPLALLRPALQRHGGVEHLWFETPGADRVTIVFACLASHHTFPEVAQLARKLPGEHLLFVNNPAKNWYSDDDFAALCRLVVDRVLSRVPAERVSCHYGSMGGHGALKAALQLGLRALVFNPQTDLDLWAAYRSGERALLWGAERHARLADWPATAWQRTPLYLACGSAVADREALSALIVQLRAAPRLTAVIEKFADPTHAGLMARIAVGSSARALQAIGRRLDILTADAPAPGMRRLPDSDRAAFWERLDHAAADKVEIQVRDGALWWQPSRHCGTR